MSKPNLRVVREGDQPAEAPKPKRAGRAAVAHARRTAIWSRVNKLAQAIGVDREDAEEVMRDHVMQVSGQRSTKKLTARQHAAVVRRLDELLQAEQARPTTRSKRAATEDGEALITADQSAAIEQLGLAIGLSRDRLRSWVVGHMAKVCGGLPWPQTRAQAIKVHEGLEAWLVRQPRSQPNQVLRRAQRCQQFDDLTPWEVKFLATLVQRKGFPTPDRRRSGLFFKGHWKQLCKLAEIERKRGKNVELPSEPS